MTAVTTKLSSKGQLFIPRKLREQLHWEAGIELTLVPTGRGIFLQPSAKKAKHNLADLRGMLKYDRYKFQREQIAAFVQNVLGTPNPRLEFGVPR